MPCSGAGRRTSARIVFESMEIVLALDTERSSSVPVELVLDPIKNGKNGDTFVAPIVGTGKCNGRSMLSVGTENPATRMNS